MNMKRRNLIMATLATGFVVALLQACTNQSVPSRADISTGIFPKGKQGPPETFTGTVYNIGLVNPDSILTTAVGNVYFEPGARSNWHSHPGGQILLITAGAGYHQIKGQPRQAIRKGDVVKCPPNTLHWHGASAENGMQQLYVVPNTEKGIVEWKQAVTDAEYAGR